jgi:autotransporter-associated beta strand protein
LVVNSATQPLILSGANTYTGGTTIRGFLALGPGGSLASTGSVNLVGIPSSFDISAAGNQTIGDLSGVSSSAPIQVILGANTLTVSSGSFGGNISGSGGLIKQGDGTLTLAGGNTYTGPTIVNCGTLSLIGGGPIGSAIGQSSGVSLANAGAVLDISGLIPQTIKDLSGVPGTLVTIANNNSLAFGTGNSTTFAGQFSGSGNLVKQGSGTVTGGVVAEAWPASERWPFGKVPAWFAHLIGVTTDTEQVTVTTGGQPFATIILATVPGNEILEVWNEFTGNVLVLARIGGQTIPLIYLFIGRALRPLNRLTVAMERVGDGDYRVRIGDRLTPELTRLRDGFNRMAARLEASGADNRRLNEQLLTLQEEERAEIARDLHDEVGPFLFAIGVDVATITRLLRDGRTAELSGPVGSIAEAVQSPRRSARAMPRVGP